MDSPHLTRSVDPVCAALAAVNGPKFDKPTAGHYWELPMPLVRLSFVTAMLALSISPLAAQAGAGPGQRIAIDGRLMWIECAGSGLPTVVLEAGHNESADTWDKIFPSVASFTRVCRYDRAGLGRSEAARAGGLRTGRHVVADLQGLLAAAGERNTAVLVGHSIGGAVVRLYADAYPKRVAALVLVDAVNEREFEAIGELLTPDQREAMGGMRPGSPEGLDIEAVFRELRSTSPLVVPVVVVARGRALADDEMPPLWSPEQRRRREQLRRDLQAELAKLSPAGELIVATRSGHFVHQEEPAVVVDAIRRAVTAWRARGDRRGRGRRPPRWKPHVRKTRPIGDHRC